MTLDPATAGGGHFGPQPRIEHDHPIPTADRPVRAYLPENLDLGPHLPTKWHPYGRWVVGGLYLRHHTEAQAGLDDFRPTHSKVLKQVLPERHYTDIMKA